MIHRVVRCAALSALLALAGTARAQDPAVEAGVDSTAFLIGDPVTVRLDFRHTAGTRFSPLFGDTLGSFLVLRRPELEQVSDTQTTGSFVVSYYDSGAVVLPPALFSYITSDDSTFRTVSSNPVPLRFALVQVDTAQPIRDIRPPIAIPISLAELALYAGIALVVLALLYWLYRLWKKRGTAGETEVPQVVRPAHLIALEELGRLREERLWQQGLTKRYYSEVTDILRRYFERRYGISAPEETTDEIMEGLRHHVTADDGVAEMTRTLLVRADLVKFARFAPGQAEHERTLEDARTIVERTKEVTAEKLPEAADAGT